jgi:hypothetical protein
MAVAPANQYINDAKNDSERCLDSPASGSHGGQVLHSPQPPAGLATATGDVHPKALEKGLDRGAIR